MTSYGLADDSPLCHLPKNLNPDQLCFLDGIRTSIQMAFLAYNRLCDTLAIMTHASSGQPSMADRTSAFLDAWSVVDMVYRLRELVQQMPRMKRAPGLRAFLDATGAAEDLRHVIQHLRNEVHEMAATGDPVFGTLAWVAIESWEEYRFQTCILISGSLRPSSHVFVDPRGKELRAEIALVTLRCKSAELTLTESIDAVARFAASIERALAPQFEGLPSHGTYLFGAVAAGPKADQ